MMDMGLLSEIINATHSGSYVFVDDEQDNVRELINSNFIEINYQVVSPEEEVAARATPLGMNYFANNTNTTVPMSLSLKNNDVNQTARSFEVENYVPTMSSKRGRGSKRAETYPFDKLEVNQSFHIPATEKNTNPAKGLASTVSSANQRYAVSTGEQETIEMNAYQTDENGKRVKGADGKFIKTGKRTVSREKMQKTREFVVRSVGIEDPRGPGARIVRIA